MAAAREIYLSSLLRRLKSNLGRCTDGIVNFHRKQEELLWAAHSEAVVAVLPTGYGKIIVIDCGPFLFLNPENENENTDVVIAISPLDAIILEQNGR